MILNNTLILLFMVNFKVFNSWQGVSTNPSELLPVCDVRTVSWKPILYPALTFICRVMGRHAGVCWFPGAAVRNCHKLDGLKQQRAIVSQFWKSETKVSVRPPSLPRL